MILPDHSFLILYWLSNVFYFTSRIFLNPTLTFQRDYLNSCSHHVLDIILQRFEYSLCTIWDPYNLFCVPKMEWYFCIAQLSKQAPNKAWTTQIMVVKFGGTTYISKIEKLKLFGYISFYLQKYNIVNITTGIIDTND